MNAGLNGNMHPVAMAYDDPDYGLLDQTGIEYLGDGDWSLPDGWIMDGVGDDSWVATSPDGTRWHIWSED